MYYIYIIYIHTLYDIYLYYCIDKLCISTIYARHKEICPTLYYHRSKYNFNILTYAVIDSHNVHILYSSISCFLSSQLDYELYG